MPDLRKSSLYGANSLFSHWETLYLQSSKTQHKYDLAFMSINLFERPGKKGLPETEPELYPTTFSRHFFCFPGGLEISLWKQDCNWLPQSFPRVAFVKHPGERPGSPRVLLLTAYNYPAPITLQGFAPSLPAGFPRVRRPYVSCLWATIRGLQHFLGLLQQHLQAP